MNYQEIVNRIQDITNQHKMLADFGYGDISDLKVRFENSSGNEEVQADYPYLFLNPGTHQRNQGMVTYNFNMIVMDMARGEVSDVPYNNMLAIQSQCQQYIDDVLAYLYFAYQDNPDVIYSGVTYTPFNERFQDNVAGMTATLTIQVPQAIDNCLNPINPKATLINRVFVNIEECPAFNTAFRVGAEVVTPGYPVDRTANEFYAQYDEPGAFQNCNTGITPLAINDRFGTTQPYYNAGDRRWTIPTGVTGVFRFDFDLLLTNIQGIVLDDQFRIQVVVNGQQQTYIDFPALPIDGTVVPFKHSFEIDAGQDTDEIVILFRYQDQGTPAPDGPIVGYTGTSTIQRITA